MKRIAALRGLPMYFGNGLFLHPGGDHFEEYRGFYPDIWVPQAEAEEAVMNFIEKNTTVITPAEGVPASMILDLRGRRSIGNYFENGAN